MGKPSTWNVEFYANGEYQTEGRLTDEQIKAITLMIDALDNANKLIYANEEIDMLANAVKDIL